MESACFSPDLSYGTPVYVVKNPKIVAEKP